MKQRKRTKKKQSKFRPKGPAGEGVPIAKKRDGVEQFLENRDLHKSSRSAGVKGSYHA